MQYFPSEGRLDKMFFPYYGKKAHVSKYCFIISQVKFIYVAHLKKQLELTKVMYRLKWTAQQKQ